MHIRAFGTIPFQMPDFTKSLFPKNTMFTVSQMKNFYPLFSAIFKTLIPNKINNIPAGKRTGNITKYSINTIFYFSERIVLNKLF